MEDEGTPSAGAQINDLQRRLVMAQSDLAVLDEQRERVKQELNGLRNVLNGVRLGQQQAAQQRETENKELAAKLKEQAATSAE